MGDCHVREGKIWSYLSLESLSISEATGWAAAKGATIACSSGSMVT
jgi:hypothetical protein